MKNLEIGWIGRLKNFKIQSKKFLNGKKSKISKKILPAVCIYDISHISLSSVKYQAVQKL